MIIIPRSFGSLNFANNDMYPTQMDISSARAQLRIRPVAGGRLFNFDYGYKANLIPNPFVVSLLINEGTIAALSAAYETLASPTTGIVGTYGTLTGETISQATWTISCGCEAISKVIDEQDAVSNANTPILFGIELYFVPDNQWVKV